MSKKILLADDSITIQKVIELTFSDEDFEVVTVGNGRLALEKLPEVQPDVVLCDIIMPEKDGYEVCQQIKQSGTFSHIPVLLLTGAFEPFDQERAVQVGSDGFLAKPFEPETLIAKVKDLLSRAPAPSAEASAATVAPAAAPAPQMPPAPEPAAPVAPPPAAPTFEAAQPAPEAPAAPTFEEPVDGGSGPSEAGPITEAFGETPAVSEDEPGLGPSFIPEEPYETFEEASFESVSEGSGEQEPLVPVTPEESATLSGTTDSRESADADSASTVMFNARDLPWEGDGPGSPPDSGQGDTAQQPAVKPQPEPPRSPDLAEEAGGAFEEVLEEDLEYQPSDAGRDEVDSVPEPAPPAEPERRPTLRTAVPSPLRDVDADFVGAPMGEARPSPSDDSPPEEEAPTDFEPEFETEPVSTPSGPEDPQVSSTAGPEPETVPSFEPEGAGPDVDAQAVQTLPGADRSQVVESFADVETDGETEEAAPAPSSEAASVPVPVDKVEKIAQRVVAQVSEKVVREIVWDVVPDLAEALIKQEIERLKAELDDL